MLASEILIKARALIEKPENWTQGEYALNAEGDFVGVSDDDATCFCSYGAVGRAASIEPDGITVVDKYLEAAAHEIAPGLSVIKINDETDHPTVLKMFDIAISKALSSEVTA